MLCFADNDVILKLAALDLFGDFLPALGVASADVRVLPQVEYVLRHKAKPFGDAVTRRIAEFLGSVGRVGKPPDEEIRLFEDTLEIHTGEAVLFAATYDQTSFILTTGDKVGLKALADSPECATVAQRLAGRVVCLEQLVLRCINHAGFEPVKAKVVPGRSCDTALRAIFGSGLTATESGVRDGLEHYINSLRASTGGLLAAD